MVMVISSDGSLWRSTAVSPEEPGMTDETEINPLDSLAEAAVYNPEVYTKDQMENGFQTGEVKVIGKDLLVLDAWGLIKAAYQFLER